MEQTNLSCVQKGEHHFESFALEHGDLLTFCKTELLYVTLGT